MWRRTICLDPFYSSLPMNLPSPNPVTTYAEDQSFQTASLARFHDECQLPGWTQGLTTHPVGDFASSESEVFFS